MTTKKLTPPMQDLYEALQRGVVCHYMKYMGQFNPSPYYFRSDTMKNCTAQVRALLKRGLAEKFGDKGYGEHEVRLKIV